MHTSLSPVRFALALVAGCALACETADPTLAVVDNAFAAAEQTSVYKAWWSVVEFPDPVAPGASSDDERAIPAHDYAYLLLAPGWTPGSSTAPARLIPVRSKTALSVARGKRLHIVVSSDSVEGNCAHGSALSQDEADFITQRIFPGDFAGRHYDAASCSSEPTPTDAGPTLADGS